MLTAILPPLFRSGHGGFSAWREANGRVSADLWADLDIYGLDGVLAGVERAAISRGQNLARLFVPRLLEMQRRGVSYGVIWPVSLDRLLALMQIRLNQYEKGAQSFAWAIHRAEATEHRLEQAMALVQYAEVAEALDPQVLAREVESMREEGVALLESWGMPAAPIALEAARTFIASKAKSRRLTPAQQTIVELAAEGLTRDQIASRLEVSPETVKRHQSDLRARQGVRTMEAAAALAKRLGEI